MNKFLFIDKGEWKKVAKETMKAAAMTLAMGIIEILIAKGKP